MTVVGLVLTTLDHPYCALYCALGGPEGWEERHDLGVLCTIRMEVPLGRRDICVIGHPLRNPRVFGRSRDDSREGMAEAVEASNTLVCLLLNTCQLQVLVECVMAWHLREELTSASYTTGIFQKRGKLVCQVLASGFLVLGCLGLQDHMRQLVILMNIFPTE